jgi:hypothetical protein
MQTKDQLSIAAEEYHSLPGTSNSRLSVLIEDPREYHYRFLSGQYTEKPQEYFDFGSAVHEVALLGDASRIVVPPDDVLSSSGSRAGKAWYAWKADNEGKLILKQSEYDAVMQCVDAMRSHPIAGPLLESIGYTERMYQYDDAERGLTVRCRPDKLCQRNGKNVVLDIKTTANTTPASFVRSVAEFGYDRQEYVYRKVLANNDVHVDAFIFIAVKKVAPYTVDCYTIREDWIVSAGEVVERALTDLARRLRENDWNAVTHNSVVELSPPNWLKYRGEYEV